MSTYRFEVYSTISEQYDVEADTEQQAFQYLQDEPISKITGCSEHCTFVDASDPFFDVSTAELREIDGEPV